jgi:hypothetical protein
MSKTALQLVQDFTDFNNLGSPAGLIGATDSTIRQYVAMLNRVVNLLKEYRFEEQKLRRTWTATPVVGFTRPAQSTTLFAQTNAAAFNEVNSNESYLYGLSAGLRADVPGSILLNGLVTPVTNGGVYNSQGPESAYYLFDTAGSTFAISGFANRDAVIARYNGTGWEYDNNASWTTFTPTSTMWLIGEYANYGPDGSTPQQYSAYIYSTGVQLTTVDFTSQQDQGLISDILGSDVRSIVTESGWNNTRRMRIFGPVSDAMWQALQVLPNAGPEFQSWIAGGRLYVSPAPAYGEELSYIVQTKNLILSSDGVTTLEALASDADTFLVPDIVVQLGLQYVWSKQKGVAGWEDTYNDFIDAVARNKVKDGAATLRLDLDSSPTIRPGIIIPAGNWNV